MIIVLIGLAIAQLVIKDFQANSRGCTFECHLGDQHIKCSGSWSETMYEPKTSYLFKKKKSKSSKI